MADQKSGVTLVELLVVVIIIGVMAFVAIPRMGFSIITGSKAKTNAQNIAAAIRYTRSLAIANAAINSQGFSLNMTGSPTCYTGFQIVDVNTTQVIETGSIDSNSVTCSGAGAGIFQFGPLGNRLSSDANGLTVGGGGKTYTITITSATGMVKCQ
jgi:prepilin-type N-terminal cleavage/methylation domain-containing protein